jgi:hypothetical protein
VAIVGIVMLAYVIFGGMIGILMSFLRPDPEAEATFHQLEQRLRLGEP